MNVLPDATQHFIAEYISRYPVLAGHQDLLLEALTHRSFAPNSDVNNERLEFLGDAVLDLVTSEILIERFPLKTEGELSKARASFVNETTLASVSEQLGLTEAILLGKGEEQTGGRAKPRLISGALEAWLGAMFSVLGYNEVKNYVQSWLESHEQTLLLHRTVDHKTQLQEHCQHVYQRVPSYDLERIEGPDHDRIFYIWATLSPELKALGQGKNKKAAEQEAAKNLFHVLMSQRKQ